MRACPHEPRPFRACEHVLFPPEGNEPEYRLLFSGSDVTPTCVACATGTPELAECCDACRLPFVRADTFGMFDGFGDTKPEPRTRDAGLVLVDETVDLRPALRERVLALTPIARAGRAAWVALTESWRLVTVELPSCEILSALPPIPPERLARPVEDPQRPHATPYPRLMVSANGRYAAVLMEKVPHGVVVDLSTGAILLALDRRDYHPDVSGWPFAFFERDGRTHAVHAIEWNLLAVSDLDRGETVAKEEGEGDNYFLGPLTVSPGGKRLATAGWVWQPVGIVRTDSLETFVTTGKPHTVSYLNQTGYHWNGPNIWLDDDRLLVWGIGDDDQRMVDGALIHDLENSRVSAWWPALPWGELSLDPSANQLWCGTPNGTSVWNVATGERIAQSQARTSAFHPSARHAAGVASDGRISIVFLQRR